MKLNPNTRLYLCKTPLEDDYRNTILFSNSEAQINYFNSKVFKDFNNTLFTYIKRDNTVKVEASIDDIINANYLFYTNTGYSNKTYFCFIKNMTYLSENSTLIEFTTDVIQTYMFDIVYNPTFIEREHVSNDAIGFNTIRENVELGEYICNSHIEDDFNTDLRLVVSSSVKPYGSHENALGGIVTGIPTGLRYYKYSSLQSMGNDLQSLQNAGKIDAVNSIFFAPSYLLGTDNDVDVHDSYNAIEKTIEIPPITSLNGYTPKNNKLLTYPYCYILATNTQNGNAILKQEVWSKNTNNKMVMKSYGVLSAGCSIRCIPLNYNGVSENLSEGINLGKFPQMNWATDTYINWLTENALNIATNTGVGLAQTFTGNIASGINTIANVINSNFIADRVPPQMVGNTNCGDVNVLMKGNKFHFYNMTIKYQFAKMIDSYFDMFGYKVNEVKIPNLHTRLNWNYIKTIDCNFDGEIPQNDLNTIKDVFNAGITFWHNPNNIYNYNLSNSII